MSDIIFYGAGKNADEKFDEWILKMREQGKTPVCFADRDRRKQHTQFHGLEVLSLLEAIEKYPNFEIYCTQITENLFEVKKYLLSLGIDKDRVKSCESENIALVAQSKKLYEDNLKIYQALQDKLSRNLFWGRLQYSFSNRLTGIYKAMICDENLEWLNTKRTYADVRYGLRGLWDVLKENYPIQTKKIYLLAFDNSWNEYEWVVDRFLEAMQDMNIRICNCVMPYSDNEYEEFKGIPCISEETFLKRIDKDTRIIIGFPGWCLETKKIVERYLKFKNILFPIADTACPQYIENDIFQPETDEVFVDVGVMDFQNSIDFSEWAVKGFKKIYAFEPDPKCYEISTKKMNTLELNFREKVELVNKGLSSANGVLDFPAEWKGSGASNNKMIQVEVVALDDYLGEDNPVTFVKMDVEGAEMSVLLGMERTIRKYKPKLAVCIYHKQEDVFTILQYLIQLVPEYKFYIRHYNSNETETVLFCKV